MSKLQMMGNNSNSQIEEVAVPPLMSTRGSRMTATGFVIMLLAVSAGVGSRDREFGLLLCLVGVLGGANLITVGVWMMAGDPMRPIGPVVLAGLGALTVAAFARGNLGAIGLILASSAVTAVAGHAGPVLCFSMFALLLLGLCLISIAVLGA